MLAMYVTGLVRCPAGVWNILELLEFDGLAADAGGTSR